MARESSSARPATRRRLRSLGAAGALLLVHCSQLQFLKPPAVPAPRGEAFTDRGSAWRLQGRTTVDHADDWAFYNRTLDGTRDSPLAEIDTTNVERLRQICTFDLGERAPFQSGPIVVDGTLYVTTAEHTYAIDAATCELRWKHTYRYTPHPPFDLKVNRGVAYAGGRLLRGANDGRLYALDAETGKELWNVVAGNADKGETFPAAPIVWHDLVFIGNAGGDNFGVTGRMMAFDVKTGGRIWSFDLVPESGTAARTWPPVTEVVPKGGGATWTSYAIDTAAGTVLLATGNAAPDFLASARAGDNLYTYSVVELDARTGTLKGWRQLIGGDDHDWDFAAAPSLVTTAGGRRLVVLGGKDGHLYALDRAMDSIRFRTAVTTIENADAPMTASGTRFCPGVNGGIEWNGPAYARTADALVVNAIDWCTTVKIAPVADLKGKTGLPWTGSSALRHPFGVQDSVRRGWLTAVDAERGTIRWRYHAATPLVAGVVATAGGLVFTGDLAGQVLAFDARRGTLRWHYDTGRPIGGGIVTYRTGGHQYLAVAAGMHAPRTWQLESPAAQVVVFGLGNGRQIETGSGR